MAAPRPRGGDPRPRRRPPPPLLLLAGAALLAAAPGARAFECWVGYGPDLSRMGGIERKECYNPWAGSMCSKSMNLMASDPERTAVYACATEANTGNCRRQKTLDFRDPRGGSPRGIPAGHRGPPRSPRVSIAPPAVRATPARFGSL